MSKLFSFDNEDIYINEPYYKVVEISFKRQATTSMKYDFNRELSIVDDDYKMYVTAILDNEETDERIRIDNCLCDLVGDQNLTTKGFGDCFILNVRQINGDFSYKIDVGDDDALKDAFIILVTDR